MAQETEEEEKVLAVVGDDGEDEEDEEEDERLDDLPVWGIVREVWSTAFLNHKHVERRGQDWGSGGAWGSPGAGV